MFAFANQAH